MTRKFAQGAGAPLAAAVLTVGSVTAAAPGAAAATQDSRAQRPNIVVVFIDDMGYADLSCYGNRRIKTENIDRLASEGIRFTQFYVNSPICSPSRTALLTGQYPDRHRITSYIAAREENERRGMAHFLDPKTPTLGSVLAGRGYATGHFGKWHLGGGRDVVKAPKFAAYGYEEGVGTYESPEPHPDITATNWIWSAHDKVRRWERTGFFVDKTLDFLRRKKDGQRCFVNLWLDDPHTPWVPSEKAPKGETRENLRDVLIETDRQIGRLLDGLRDLGIDRETLVIFTSDNGPLPTFNGVRNVGLRASKLSLYEGGIRMPFLLRWPGQVPAARVDEKSVISALDLFPTFLAITGVRATNEFDGQDMSAALRGETSPERANPLFWEYGRNEEWFRYPKSPGDRSPNLAVRSGRWKLLVNADGSNAELYDLDVDSAERNNVIGAHQKTSEVLRQKTIDWRRSLPAL